MATDFRIRAPNQFDRHLGARAVMEVAWETTFTRERAARDRINVQRQNIMGQMSAQRSAQQAQTRRAAISARSNLQATAAAHSIRVNQAVTASGRLLSEFNRERDMREDLRRRQSAQAVGRKTAGFGASGISSAGAGQEAAKQSALIGNIQASQGNTRKEGILNMARQAISGQKAALAGASIQAAGNVAAASQFGQLFQRKVSGDTGIDITTHRYF